MNATIKHVVPTLWIALWICTLLQHPSAAQTARGTDIAVVVHPDTPVSDLSLSEVRKVLLGERQYWNSKLPVVLLIRAPVARERDVVLRVIYQMSEAQFRQYWIGKVFRADSAAAPKAVYSNEMSVSLVTSIPGSVGFVDASQVPKGVKVIRLGGLLPGEKGYPLN